MNHKTLRKNSKVYTYKQDKKISPYTNDYTQKDVYNK